MDHPTQHDAPIIYPDWARSPYSQFRRRFEEEVRFFHLSISSLGQVARSLPLAEIAFELAKEEPDYVPAKAEKAIERSREEVRWATEEIDRGYPILHSHAVVALWSILEVLVEDLVVAWLANRREEWQKDEISKLRIDIGIYHTLTDDQRVRYLVDALARSLNVGLRSGIGRFDKLLSVFGLSPSVGPNVQRALHELCQVRNVIVHCACQADERFIRECPWLGLKVGDRVPLTHPVYGWYAEAVARYGERILNQLLVTLGNKGCTCPGADEIGQRP